MLKVIHRFSKHCSYHLQGELVGYILEDLYRAGSRWQVGCDKSEWNGIADCYPIGNEHVVEKKR
jgi:hypothetical protein